MLGGCASTPFATTGPDAGATARLAIGDRVHYTFVPGRDGIISVDGRTVPEGSAQAMVGPSFESLFHLTDQACPAARIRYATPAALLDAEDTYIATLPAADKTRVASAAPRDASGGYSACANRDGASCSVAAGLRAIEQAGLTRGFVASACRQFGKPV